MKLSVVGMGKLGACTAACLAAKGFDVVGIDINDDFVKAVNQGKAPVNEPLLQEYMTAARGRLRATHDYDEAMRETDVTFFIVPTPSGEGGHFSDRYLRDALRHSAESIKSAGKKYHLFVITSTVSPNTTDDSLIPLIESVSGKKVRKGFGVCYNPEFIALGNVIKDFLNPDVVLIGESDPNAGDMLAKIYEKVCDNKPFISRMSIVSAEITKLSINSFVTMKISFANTLSNICEGIKNADIDAITAALGHDKRISPYYLKGGIGFGGPCFPRDNKAFIAFAMKHGIEAKLARATDEVNLLQSNHLTSKVFEHLSGHNTVAVLGLAYKPNTPVIEESPAVMLIDQLLKKEVEIIVYDPLSMDNARARFGDSILYASSAKDCFAYASLCVITTQAEEFQAIDESYIFHDPTTIIDCWRTMDRSSFSKKVKYVGIGMFNG